MLKGDRSGLGHAYFNASVIGKDLGIDNEIGNLETWVSTRDADSLYNKPIFMLHRVWNNIRMGVTNNAINFQSSKYHRFMFGAKEWYISFDINNDTVTYKDHIDGSEVTVDKWEIAERNMLQGLGIKIPFNKGDIFSESAKVFENQLITFNATKDKYEVSTKWDKNLPRAIKVLNSEGEITTGITTVKIDSIKPNRYQPRKIFNPRVSGN